MGKAKIFIQQAYGMILDSINIFIHICKLDQQIYSMRNNNNKQQLKSNSNNHDYLNFIRRNQQIVKEFKQISQIDKKANQLKKAFSNTGNNQKVTLQADRYAEVPPFFQDSIFNYRQRARVEIASLNNDGFFTLQKNQNNLGTKTRKETDLTQKSGDTEIYTRNLSIPTKFDRTSKQEKQFPHQVVSQIKFPKLNTRNQQFQEVEGRSNSQTSLSLQKEKLSSRSIRKQKNQKLNKDSWKKNYAPLSVQTIKHSKQYPNPIHCSINSLKFNDKVKINTKLIKTYYDYQNLLELKERVAELLPTFKPIQKKKDKIQILQLEKNQEINQLEQFLQANMIKRGRRGTSKTKTKLQINESMQNQINEAALQIVNTPRKNNSQNTEHNQILEQELYEQQLLGEEEQKLQKELTLQKSQKLLKSSQTSPTKKPKKQIKILQKNNVSEQTVYHNKIQSYRQFLFLVNFAHRVFDPLIIKQDSEKSKNQNKYKFYIGPGNNSLLVKSLMKRRFWWVQVDDPKQANFVWTQLKINTYYQYQLKTSKQQIYDKLDQDQQAPSKQKKINKSKAVIDSNKKQEQPKVGGIVRGQLPENEKKIFTKADNFHLSKLLQKAVEQNPTLKNFTKFQSRLKYLPQEFLKKRQEDYTTLRVHNHFMFNYQIGNKKALFYNLKHYYEILGVNPFNSIPLTFHIKKGVQDPQYAKFLKQYKKIKSELDKNDSKKKLSRNVWIVKPGELSNRGNGITVIDEIYQLNNIIKSKDKHKDGGQKTYIVQKYIQKPMLYKNRKFDIRHYMMISRLHGKMRAYWFSEGYIRTSSYQYDLEEVGDVMIHLTNDAIQKHGASYGKYEEGNKLSYAEYQRYLDSTYPQKKYSFIESIYPRMKQIAADAVKSTYLWMDPDKLQHNFQVFGLDFMIDANFNVWLIQVNTNPCLQLSSGLLGRIIPTMVQNSLRLCLDPLFPPTAHYLNTIKYLAPDSPMQRLQFELIFDESRDGKKIEQLFRKNGKANCGQIQEEDQTYDNDGKQIQLGGDLQ